MSSGLIIDIVSNKDSMKMQHNIYSLGNTVEVNGVQWYTS
jgi:hypothetical protein